MLNKINQCVSIVAYLRGVFVEEEEEGGEQSTGSNQGARGGACRPPGGTNDVV